MRRVWASKTRRAELHLKLYEKYLREAEELLKKRNYVQASEKLWGAASQNVKSVAAKRGLELRRHGELHGFTVKIREELRDPEVTKLWACATSLHQNFYENWLPPEIVSDYAEAINLFIKRLRELI